MILGVVIFLYWGEPVPRGLLLGIVGGVRRDCWIALLVRRGHEDSLVRSVILTRLSRIGCYGYDRGGTVCRHMPFFYPPLGLGGWEFLSHVGCGCGGDFSC